MSGIAISPPPCRSFSPPSSSVGALSFTLLPCAATHLLTSQQLPHSLQKHPGVATLSPFCLALRLSFGRAKNNSFPLNRFPTLSTKQPGCTPPLLQPESSCRGAILEPRLARTPSARPHHVLFVSARLAA